MTSGLAPRPCAGPVPHRHARASGRAGRPFTRCPAGCPSAGCAGYSLAELATCLAVVAVAAAFALAHAGAARKSLLIDGAARHVALAFRVARTDAVRQGRSVAVQFRDHEAGLTFRMVADGNGNGVRRAEIDAGIDPALGPERRVEDDFPGTRLGVGTACPGIDGGDALTTDSPGVQFGEAGLAVFTPSGTASSGTAYLTDGTSTYAVRVLGTTGRTRVLRFDPLLGQWVVR